MIKFRKLTADEVECRISEVDKQGRFLRLLLYKTARTDAALLDETVGATNWQNDYREIDGKMYCGVGIWDEEKKQWIWKWNVGTESNTEAEKGQASDALKRAGFTWGCGVELYSAPRITIWQGFFKDKWDKFDVTVIGYDAQGKIKDLEIVNTTQGCVCYSMKDGRERKINKWPTPTPKQDQEIATSASPPRNDSGGKIATAQAPRKDGAGGQVARATKEEVPFTYTDADAPPEPKIPCMDCGKIITKTRTKSAEEVAKQTVHQFGLPLCAKCAMKRYETENAKQEGAKT